MRDLADVGIVCVKAVKAVEGVVDVLSRSNRNPITTRAPWSGYSADCPYDSGNGDEQM